MKVAMSSGGSAAFEGGNKIIYFCIRIINGTMKKVFIILTAILGAIIVLWLVLSLFLSLFLTSNQASTPDEIARKAGLKLPAYEITKTEDNMDRSASAWSWYNFEIKFKEPLTESFLKKVENKKNCSHQGDSYVITDESPDDWSYTIHIYPAENCATLSYMFWDVLS